MTTNEEREALARVIAEAESQTDAEGSWALPEDVADAILASDVWRNRAVQGSGNSAQNSDHQAEAPSEHDDECEAEYVVGAAAYTDCGCADRAADLEVQSLATIIGNVQVDSEQITADKSRAILLRDVSADWAMEIAGEVQAHGFHLAARPVVDDAMVAKIARAIYAESCAMVDEEPHWDHEPQPRRDYYAQVARTALLTALTPDGQEKNQ